MDKRKKELDKMWKDLMVSLLYIINNIFPMFLCPGNVVKIEIHSVVYKTIASAHLRGLLTSSLNFRTDFVMLFPHYVRRLLLA